jgi:hypothetical protein
MRRTTIVGIWLCLEAGMKTTLMSLLIILGPFVTSIRADWFLNTRGPGEHVTITRFGDDGLPIPFGPSLVPSGSWPDVVHLAWPSAVALPGGGVRVYASAFDGNRWAAIVAWEEDAGASEWRRLGPVIVADASEPHGIATSHVVYDSADGYWKAWWVRLNGSGVGDAVFYATSRDGLTWYRLPWAVYRPSTSHDAGGIGLDYVCQSQRTGLWHIFLSAYPAGLGSSSALRVSSDVSWGPYGWVESLMLESRAHPRTITAGAARTGVLSVDSTEGLQAGGAALITNGQQASSQLVTISAVDEARSQVLLRGPLVSDVAGWTITPIERRYISPSYVREADDGNWSGIWTAYHPVAGLTAEYTVAARAGQYGPWSIDRMRPAPIFAPITRAGMFSTENPARVSTSASCSE